MNFENISHFLKWSNGRKNIAFTFDARDSNFVETPIDRINFISPGNSNVHTLRCPINRRENKNFLRIIRKALFEVESKMIITSRVKDFFSRIPGDFQNVSEIYDIQLLRSLIHYPHSADKYVELTAENIVSEFKKQYLLLSEQAIKTYNNILLPAVFVYSEIEKTGLPTEYLGLLYSYYNLDGTVSGRLSNCSFDSKRFINPLNLPKEERKIIKAIEGYKIVNVDYNAMEMRVLAFLSQDEKILSVFQEGKDIYTWIGQNIFNIEEIDSTKRQIIKDLCFLIIYGGTEYGFSKQQNCSIENAQYIFKKFYELFPQIEQWSLQTQINIIEKGFVQSYFGRMRYLDLEDQETALRQGQNFIVQSTANDITMLAILELSKKLIEDSGILMHIHDSCIVLSPQEKIEGNYQIIHDTMKYPEKLKEFNIDNLYLYPVISVSDFWE